MASQPGRERDYADATSRRAAEIQTAMVSIRRLGHETEFFRRSLRRCEFGPRPLFLPADEEGVAPSGSPSLPTFLARQESRSVVV